MLQLLLGFVPWFVLALLGMGVGWWLRGRRRLEESSSQRSKADRKYVAEQALAGLNAATEAVRSCVAQHVECIQTIESELRESSGTEPAVISNAADSIVSANGLVRHQFGDVHRLLVTKYDEIHDHLSDPYNLLVTFASLDRQQHVYRQVLRSLETLATELASNVAGHGQRLKQIDGQLADDEHRDAGSLSAAIGQILDAASELEQQMESAEQHIGKQAESVQMQAVLSHTDLLTSLPNRRAFDAELALCDRRSRGKGAYSTVVLVDLDQFARVNAQYGHQGGDVILRQAAATIKQLMNGKDLVARFGGDTFGILLHQTTLHDALPIVERIRTTLGDAQFSHGSLPLRMTASIGVAQLLPEEGPADVIRRGQESLAAAKQSGGNGCFWHDGQGSSPVSSAFKLADRDNAATPSLLSLFRRTVSGIDAEDPIDTSEQNGERPVLTGRSLFVANLQRRINEWKRGGPAVSVIVLRVDQREELITRFGAHAQSFLHRVLGRLLEAVTRDMDERCEFEDGLFAVLLPSADEVNALAIAERLRSQIRQCKVRMSDALWDLTASIGVAHCAPGTTVVEVMQAAEGAMKQAIVEGGDATCVREAVAEDLRAAVV
jgi:diguanylate cyclase (GGDEF)-like protein